MLALLNTPESEGGYIVPNDFARYLIAYQKGLLTTAEFRKLRQQERSAWPWGDFLQGMGFGLAVGLLAGQLLAFL